MYSALQNLQDSTISQQQLQNLLCHFKPLCRLQNLQGLQIDNLNHGAGATLELKGLNTLGEVTTDEGSVIVMEDDEEGAGTAMDLLTAAGNMEVIGNHRIRKATTLGGAKIIAHGQRTKRAAAPAEQAPEEPVEEADDDEEYQEEVTEEEELLNLKKDVWGGLHHTVDAVGKLTGIYLQNLQVLQRAGASNQQLQNLPCNILWPCNLQNLGGLRIGKLTARSGSNVTLEGHNSVG